LRSLLDLLAQLAQFFDGVREVTDGGDAGGYIEKRVFGKEMGVHIPQARKKHLSAAVDGL
jgi:hypothetical protein